MKYLFETERLRVRRFEQDDAQRLFEIHSDEAVRMWIPNESYADIEEAREAIGFFAARFDEGRLPFVLAAESKETGMLIGDTGINEVEGASGAVEIGYVICREHSGNGYATELVAAMTDFAAKAFEKNTLYGRVLHGNSASVRVLEKNGYEFITEEYGAEDDPYGNGMLIYKRECL